MQRLGCAARDKSLEGKGIIVAEPKYFDDEIEKAAARAEQRKAKNKSSQTVSKKTDSDEKKLEKSMMDFVNAEQREGLGCYRLMANNHFWLDTAGE